MSNTQKTETKKAPPVARVTVRTVRGNIWARSTDKGTFFSATFERGYKTQEGWKNTHGFDLDGLLALQHAVGLAIDKVMELRAADISDQARPMPTPEELGETIPEDDAF